MRRANPCPALEIEKMAGRLSFFPVGNGDMTLVQTEGGHKILIDMNILAAADESR